MKVYNARCKKNGWFCSIHNWMGVDGVHYLFRGDSDPQLMYQGRFYNAYDIEDEIERAIDEFNEDVEEDEQIKSIKEYLDFFPDAEEYMFELFYAFGNEDKTYKGESNSKKLMKAIGRNEEEEFVLRKSTKLDNLDEYAEMYAPCVRDDAWDALQSDKLVVSEHIEDYQVLRTYCIECAPRDPLESATEDEKKRYEEAVAANEDYCEIFEEIFDRLYEEGEDAYWKVNVGEVAQEWVNCKTGNIIRIGKPYDKNPHLCDLDATEFEIISNKMLDSGDDCIKKVGFNYISERQKDFAWWFDSESQFTNDGLHYDDLSVHPFLTERGYKPIHNMDWDATNGMYFAEPETQMANDAFNAITQDMSMGELMADLVNGGEWERRLKTSSIEQLVIRNRLDERYRERFDIACKIMNRNHYKITDSSLYMDMFVAECELGKDIHNKYYVCPTNLKEMHDTIYSTYARIKEKVEFEHSVMEANKSYELKYRRKVDKYFSLCIQFEGGQIGVCPTIRAMAEEGKHMHHCVFHNHYYESNNLILLVRTMDNKRISTMELDTKAWKIVQNRGANNSKPKWDDEAREAVMDNIKLFKECSRKESVINTNIALETELSALPQAA